MGASVNDTIKIEAVNPDVLTEGANSKLKIGDDIGKISSFDGGISKDITENLGLAAETKLISGKLQPLVPCLTTEFSEKFAKGSIGISPKELPAVPRIQLGQNK